MIVNVVVTKEGKEIILKQTDWAPQDDRIIVQRSEPEQKRGLIIIPDTAKETPLTGVVIRMGEGITYKLEDMSQLKGDRPVVGDVIMFGKYAGTEIPELLPNEKDPLVALRWNDIIAIRDTNIYGKTREYITKG